MPASLHLRPATVDNVPLIHQLIRELADYEHMLEEFSATEAQLCATLFGERPAVECTLAYAGADPAGFALFFANYSTFCARPGVYLEDLFVRPAFRRHGIGRALFRHVAHLACQRSCARLEWMAVDTDARAQEFYASMGARRLVDRGILRLSGEQLARFQMPGSDQGSHAPASRSI